MMYVLQRGGYFISLWFGIVLFSFVLFHAAPTDPARVMLGPNAEEAQVSALREKLGLDKPLSTQFASYLGKISTFDFGSSFVDGRSISAEVWGKLSITLALIALSLILALAYVVATSAIEIAGFRKVGDFIDFIWVILPTMFSGLIVALLAAYYYPFNTFTGTLSGISNFLYLLPPAFVLALYPMAILSRIFKEDMRRINRSQFVLAARSRGLSKWEVLRKHVLKNALIPFLAALTNQIPILFTSTFIVEIIFSIPGIGSLLIKSLLQRDFPMLEGIVIFNGSVVILVYLLFELAYPLIDPRIRDQRGV